MPLCDYAPNACYLSAVATVQAPHGLIRQVCADHRTACIASGWRLIDPEPEVMVDADTGTRYTRHAVEIPDGELTARIATVVQTGSSGPFVLVGLGASEDDITYYAMTRFHAERLHARLTEMVAEVMA
ncbi:MAG TPA: hypothetical protein VF377_10390 [Acidimicrobiia bacterium]